MATILMFMAVGGVIGAASGLFVGITWVITKKTPVESPKQSKSKLEPDSERQLPNLTASEIMDEFARRFPSVAGNHGTDKRIPTIHPSNNKATPTPMPSNPDERLANHAEELGMMIYALSARILYGQNDIVAEYTKRAAAESTKEKGDQMLLVGQAENKFMRIAVDRDYKDKYRADAEKTRAALLEKLPPGNASESMDSNYREPFNASSFSLIGEDLISLAQKLRMQEHIPIIEVKITATQSDINVGPSGYGKRIVLQTNRAFWPIKLELKFDGPITKAEFYSDTRGMNYEPVVQQRKKIDSNRLLFSRQGPVFTTTNPITLVIVADQPVNLVSVGGTMENF